MNKKIGVNSHQNYCIWRYYDRLFIRYTYPSPESSGMYLPQPISGGKDKVNARNQIIIINFTALENEETFPVIRPP